MKQTILSMGISVLVSIGAILQVSAATSRNEFDIVMVAMSTTTWEAIRYDTVTGEAWLARNGKWMVIEDKAEIPKGKYVIKMTALADDWAALRLEVNSGHSWQCRGGVWVEMPIEIVEPGKQAVDAKPSSDESKK